ncbi:hypothetical protein CCR85_14310 [Rhodothalassium salexigens]|nr:hypothetical protein [Rhodothalassium salexigens]
MCWITKTLFDRPGFLTGHARNGINFALMIDGDKSPTITLRQIVAALLKLTLEGRTVFCAVPAFLKCRLDIGSAFSGAAGLLPFGQSEVQRRAIFAALVSIRQVPAMLKKEPARNLIQLTLKVREIDRPHIVGVDTAPHRMGVTATIFLMKDQRHRLTLKAHLIFDPTCCQLKDFRPDIFCLRR